MAAIQGSALSKIPSPGEAIRGPRRVRTTSVPPEPSVEVLPEIAAEARALSAAKPRPETSRVATTAKLPRSPVKSNPDQRVVPQAALRAADITLSTRRSSPVRRAMWFSAGILLGALALSAFRGDMHGARTWLANALRSLERRPPPAEVAPSPSTSEVDPEVPCTAEDCAILTAPFRDAKAKAAKPHRELPTVRAEDLPHAPVPVAYLPPAAPAPVAPAKPAETGDAVATAAVATASAAAGASAAPTTQAPTGMAAAFEAAMAGAPSLSPDTAPPATASATASAAAAAASAPIAPAAPPVSPAPPSTVPVPPPTGTAVAPPAPPAPSSSPPAATSDTSGKSTVAENE